MAAASSGLERRDPELQDASIKSWDLEVSDLELSLNPDGDDRAGRGAIPSGEGGCLPMQQAVELMMIACIGVVGSECWRNAELEQRREVYIV